MATDVLESLINEIDETYKNAEFFDIRTFNKEQELPFQLDKLGKLAPLNANMLKNGLK